MYIIKFCTIFDQIYFKLYFFIFIYRYVFLSNCTLKYNSVFVSKSSLKKMNKLYTAKMLQYTKTVDKPEV